ncbi:hypothetical protein F5I97DRAFT_589164 [Phlebopus sp. FC_14]|nr:hypothetical protein F5I97DRAFT_589164 [Phlebopus sp. FC_14]
MRPASFTVDIARVFCPLWLFVARSGPNRCQLWRHRVKEQYQRLILSSFFFLLRFVGPHRSHCVDIPTTFKLVCQDHECSEFMLGSFPSSPPRPLIYDSLYRSHQALLMRCVHRNNSIWGSCHSGRFDLALTSREHIKNHRLLCILPPSSPQSLDLPTHFSLLSLPNDLSALLLVFVLYLLSATRATRRHTNIRYPWPLLNRFSRLSDLFDGPGMPMHADTRSICRGRRARTGPVTPHSPRNM